MMDQALGHFSLTADINLHIMKEKQSLDHITSSVLTGAGKYLICLYFACLVHGDTTTTFASALRPFTE
jgi:UDP-N-acetylglucosamine 2-epimerase (non-hydrolysing)